MAGLAGTVATYPLHLWLIRRSVIRWGGEDVARKVAWYWQAALILAALAVILAAIFLVMRSV